MMLQIKLAWLALLVLRCLLVACVPPTTTTSIRTISIKPSSKPSFSTLKPTIMSITKRTSFATTSSSVSGSTIQIFSSKLKPTPQSSRASVLSSSPLSSNSRTGVVSLSRSSSISRSTQHSSTSTTSTISTRHTSLSTKSPAASHSSSSSSRGTSKRNSTPTCPTTVTSSSVGPSPTYSTLTTVTSYPVIYCDQLYDAPEQIYSLDQDQSGFTYAIYGAIDQHGYLSSLRALGTWATTPVDDVPDIIFLVADDLSSVDALLRDGRSVTFDQSTQAIYVNGCELELGVPMPWANTSSTQTSSEALQPTQSPITCDKYSNKGTFQVKVSYTNACGNPDNLHNLMFSCQDITTGPATSWITQYPRWSPTQNKTPGLFSATCNLADAATSRNQSPGCILVLPALENLCALNEQLAAPGVIDQVKLQLERYGGALPDTFSQVLDALGSYCTIQDVNNGTLQDWLCGSTPDTTEMQALLTDWGDHTSSTDYQIYIPTYLDGQAKILGVVDSDNIQDLTIGYGGKDLTRNCTACVNHFQMYNSSWSTFYSGDLDIYSSVALRFWEEVLIAGTAGYMGDIANANSGNYVQLCQNISVQIGATYAIAVWLSETETFAGSGWVDWFKCYAWSIPTFAANITFAHASAITKIQTSAFS